MRILYLNHTSQVSGAERSLLTLLTELPDSVSAAVACPRGPLFDAVEELGVQALPLQGTDASLKLHPIHTSKAALKLVASGRELRRVSRAFKADLVHANSIRAGVIGVIARRLGGAPVVVHIHDRLPPGRLSRATLKFVAWGSDAILACSEYAADQPALRENGSVHVVHNPIDLVAFDPGRHERDAVRAKLGLEPNSLTLSVIAQITPWKAQDDAVRALAMVLPRHPEARLLLVGSPKFIAKSTRYDNQKFAAELAELIGSLGLEGHVRLLGERSDIPEILAATDVVLVPSWEEPFGMAMIEAMAMGVPVIATSVGGTKEIIDGANGVLLPPRQPQIWAEAIERLLADRERRREMGRHSRERVSEYLNAPVYARRVVSVYEDVLRTVAAHS